MSDGDDTLYQRAVDIAMDALERPECDRHASVRALGQILLSLLDAGDSEKADCVRRLITRLSP